MAGRVALASSDGKSIDMHFNQADVFYIYEIDEDGYSFVEKRNIIKEHVHSESGFDLITETLKDCRAVFVAQIGPGAARYLLKNDLRVFEAPYPVEAVLQKLANENIINSKI